MIDQPDSTRRAAFRAAIERFLQERRDAKLEKLPEDAQNREALLAQFQAASWIEDAARRVSQIQAVTHSLKAIHPDARGTNLYCPPALLPGHAELGSHVLGGDFAGDVVGNAAALDVYKFLRLQANGMTLLDALLADDPDLLAAFSSDPDQAGAWCKAFANLVQPRGELASHTHAKQVYWLVDEMPTEDSAYHLLAPLYASSLTQRVHTTINDDRFSDAAKAAREARREKRDHPAGFAEYPHLAVQKLGGTKPQNISQLNSERGGANYLLASLPPQWKSKVRPPLNIDSVFSRFGARDLVHTLVAELREFLEGDPTSIKPTRDFREDLFDRLVDELAWFASELHDALSPGWSTAPACQLPMAEQLWLDPGRATHDDEFHRHWQRLDWPEEIGRSFGYWLNSELKGRLPVGLVELREWAKELLGDEIWMAHLKNLGRQMARDRRAAKGDAA
ncbi:CRISPR-associated Csy1 family protein [Tahibacter aquaticus]|uniref:CRISPR-associated Csy1 family protein n=1 Tax=Tahibacter aquaticus TaxID=520092 RepID=A0A4R6Z7K8_9GAMM|nr:type I-F CRISPR-associated protein Csy1 [Tahibacter aquaticus]TDR47714.1 CRISPR-associated Csy1 family protein [Tahibacter aquaticus]